MQNQLEKKKYIFEHAFDIEVDKCVQYLALLEVLVGQHEVAELGGGAKLVGQRLADRLVQLPVRLLAVAVAVVHLILQLGYPSSAKALTDLLTACALGCGHLAALRASPALVRQLLDSSHDLALKCWVR